MRALVQTLVKSSRFIKLTRTKVVCDIDIYYVLSVTADNCPVRLNAFVNNVAATISLAWHL